MEDINICEKYENLISKLDDSTYKHSLDTASLCGDIASSLGCYDPEKAYTIGLLHDVGKIYIPGIILDKPDQLTPLERSIIDLHSYYGYVILKESGLEPDITLPVLYHHSLTKPHLGGDITEDITADVVHYTFLVHSVDVYDAMSEKRAYHNPMPVQRIMDVLSEDWMCPPEIKQELWKKGRHPPDRTNVYVVNKKIS